MEVEVWSRKIKNIILGSEFQVSTWELQYYLRIFLTICTGRGKGFENLDCAVDALIETGEL